MNLLPEVAGSVAGLSRSAERIATVPGRIGGMLGNMEPRLQILEREH